MQFDIDTKVFYPAHGAGWIKDRKEIEFAGTKRTYFEIEFLNNPLTISTPVESFTMLRIRHVHNSHDLREKISSLKETVSLDPNTDDYNTLIGIIKKLDSDGQVESFIQIIQYCKHIKTQREAEGRLIPLSIKKYIKTSLHHIVGELAVTEGLTFEEAADIFKSLTDLDPQI